jgi:hypothetical protein
MALDDGLKTYELNEPIDEPEAAFPKAGMADCKAHNRKQQQKYIPSMQGNKYQVALAQITTSFGTSDTSMALAKMSVKLMNKGIHQRADIVGMVMARVLLKLHLRNGVKRLRSLLARR